MSKIEFHDRGLLLPCPQCGQRNRIAYERLGQTFRCGRCRAELRGPDEPLEVKSASAFDALTRSSALPVLADFWAPWCGPCKMMAPELAKAAAEGASRWLIVKVNTEELPTLAERFRISGIPTLVLFRDGQELTRQSGAMPSARIRHFIEQRGRPASNQDV